MRELSVAENLLLGAVDGPTTLAGKRQWAAKQLAPYDLDISPDALVGQLSTSQRQFLEIVKALAADPKVLLLDEPTSSLDISGVEKLSEHHPADRRGGRGGRLCQSPPAGDPRACRPRHHSARRRRSGHLRGQRKAIGKRSDRADGRPADRGGISRARRESASSEIVLSAEDLSGARFHGRRLRCSPRRNSRICRLGGQRAARGDARARRPRRSQRPGAVRRPAGEAWRAARRSRRRHTFAQRRPSGRIDLSRAWACART